MLDNLLSYDPALQGLRNRPLSRLLDPGLDQVEVLLNEQFLVPEQQGKHVSTVAAACQRSQRQPGRQHRDADRPTPKPKIFLGSRYLRHQQPGRGTDEQPEHEQPVGNQVSKPRVG